MPSVNSALGITEVVLRDAHQSLFAARMRSFDMLAVSDFIARRASGLFSLEMWGGATFDTCMRFLGECPYERLRYLREKIPNVCWVNIYSVKFVENPNGGQKKMLGHIWT